MSNYYEILGVWRDASPEDIELAAQTAYEHWQGALSLHDPLAPDWLQIVEQARNTLLDPARRADYDRQLEDQPEEVPVFSPGFPWRAYLCVLLTVPVLLAAFVLVLGAIANSGSLGDVTAFSDALLRPMIAASAVALPLGLTVLVIAARGRRTLNRLRLLELGEERPDPVLAAQIEDADRLSEFTDVAVWVVWGADVIVIAFWVWLVVLLIGNTG
jgi:hypothetical protein